MEDDEPSVESAPSAETVGEDLEMWIRRLVCREMQAAQNTSAVGDVKKKMLMTLVLGVGVYLAVRNVVGRLGGIGPTLLRHVLTVGPFGKPVVESTAEPKVPAEGTCGVASTDGDDQHHAHAQDGGQVPAGTQGGTEAPAKESARARPMPPTAPAHAGGDADAGGACRA